MSERNAHLNWLLGYRGRRAGPTTNTYEAEYGLRDLMEKGYIPRRAGTNFLKETGLTDFHWVITWPEDFELPDDMLVDRIGDVQGYVIFVHGWTGNYRIWEDTPALVTLSNRRLVSLAIDHNGFGESVFENLTPRLEDCNPPAAMRTLQKWIDLLRLRRQPGAVQRKVVNWVGHSMGGATLFYMNPMLWDYGEVTRYALSPALLLEDEAHRAFYTTLGLGIGILQRLPVLEVVEKLVKPTVIQTLAAGASRDVKDIHRQQYDATPRGITGATFMAMGRLRDAEIPRDFDLMRVMLGHRDPLVGLLDMIDLLCKLEFPAGNMHVVPGTHYMFSVGDENPMNAYQHAQNRELVVEDILQLHNKALDKQKTGRQFG